MTIRLFGSWFSPFARKVALALELKGIAYEPVDALARDAQAELKRLNPRIEVPVLLDGDLVVVNSSDIVQYLDWRYPQQPIYPPAIEDRVAARALERVADARVDPILVDCSYWKWAERDDQPPAGLIETGQRDLDSCLAELERVLAARPKPWPFGAPGLLECTWFPHLVALRAIGFAIDAQRFPATQQWLAAMRAHPAFANDAKRTAAYMREFLSGSHERRKIFWRGDRIEWLLSRGFHGWLFKEIEAGRAVFPPG
jgi:glutathione S-transferase